MTLSRLWLLSQNFLLTVQLLSQPAVQNNVLQGHILYQSSGNKPAVGAQVKEKDSSGDYSKDNGAYRLIFQTKRNGAAMEIEIGPDTQDGQKIELVNEKEVKSAKLPANVEEVLNIIVCPKGNRDVAAQNYYRILRTSTDRELEKKKKEVQTLMAQKEQDFQRIGALIAQLEEMRAALDSSKIYEQAFHIASINTDQTSQMIRDALSILEQEENVQAALDVLEVYTLDSMYRKYSAMRKTGKEIVRKSEEGIFQVIEGYELKISILRSQYRYEEVAEYYWEIASICKEEEFDKALYAKYLSQAGYYCALSGEEYDAQELAEMALDIQEAYPGIDSLDLAFTYQVLSLIDLLHMKWDNSIGYTRKILSIREKRLPAGHPELADSYYYLGVALSQNDRLVEGMDFLLKSATIREQAEPVNKTDLAASYQALSFLYGNMKEPEKEAEYEQKAFDLYTTDMLLMTALGSVNVAKISLLEDGKFSYKRFIDKAVHIKSRDLDGVFSNSFLSGLYPGFVKMYNSIDDHEHDRGKFAARWLEIDTVALWFFNKILPPGDKAFAPLYYSIGFNYLKLNQLPEAKAAFEKSEIIEKEENLFFAWAVYYSLQNDREKAIDHLQKAVVVGFSDLNRLETEPDLQAIREEKVYKDVVKKLKKKRN